MFRHAHFVFLLGACLVLSSTFQEVVVMYCMYNVSFKEASIRLVSCNRWVYEMQYKVCDVIVRWGLGGYDGIRVVSGCNEG